MVKEYTVATANFSKATFQEDMKGFLNDYSSVSGTEGGEWELFDSHYIGGPSGSYLWFFIFEKDV